MHHPWSPAENLPLKKIPSDPSEVQASWGAGWKWLGLLGTRRGQRCHFLLVQIQPAGEEVPLHSPRSPAENVPQWKIFLDPSEVQVL